MNIRGQAKADLSFTLKDGERGFGLPVVIDDGTHRIGDDTSDPLYAQTGRVSFFIDPDTGMGVDGTFGHCVVDLSAMKTAGFEVDPRNITDPGWIISMADIDGAINSYTVKRFRPDFTLGVLLLTLDGLTRPDNSVDEAILTVILQDIGIL